MWLVREEPPTLVSHSAAHFRRPITYQTVRLRNDPARWQVRSLSLRFLRSTVPGARAAVALAWTLHIIAQIGVRMNGQHNGTAVFLEILPNVQRHACFTFRGMKDFNRFEDCVQETLALCWLWTCRLWENGKDAREFPTTLASYATRHVKSGRSFVGKKCYRNDVLSPLAQTIHGFVTQSLPEHQSTASPAPWMEQLVDQPGSRVAQ